MESFKQPFTRIQDGYSQKRQLPRVGEDSPRDQGGENRAERDGAVSQGN